MRSAPRQSQRDTLQQRLPLAAAQADGDAPLPTPQARCRPRPRSQATPALPAATTVADVAAGAPRSRLPSPLPTGAGLERPDAQAMLPLPTLEAQRRRRLRWPALTFVPATGACCRCRPEPRTSRRCRVLCTIAAPFLPTPVRMHVCMSTRDTGRQGGADGHYLHLSPPPFQLGSRAVVPWVVPAGVPCLPLSVCLSLRPSLPLLLFQQDEGGGETPHLTANRG